MQAAGVLSGTVTDNKDPDQMGRVQVSFPSFGSEVSSSWARVVQPLAGSAYGQYILPEVGDEVLVAFENNSLDHPVVIGGLYNSGSKQSDTYDADNYIKNIKTKAGNEIRFLDKPGSEQITITNKTANDNQVILTVADNGKITIQSNGKIELTAPEIDLAANKTFSIKGGEVTISGTKISINSDGDLAMQGAQTKLNGQSALNMGAPQIQMTAQAQLTIDGGPMATVKSSAMMEVNGGAMLTVKGDMVMIN